MKSNKQQQRELADWCEKRGDTDTAEQIRTLYQLCVPADTIAAEVGVSVDEVRRVTREAK